MHWQLKQKCWLGPKDYNDVGDDNACGTRRDDNVGASDDDGASIGFDDPKGTFHDGWGVIGDDNEASTWFDDIKGAYNDGWGVIGELIPPNCESCSIMTSVNHVATWRVYK